MSDQDHPQEKQETLLDVLTQIAGAALAEMGVVDPGETLLEPIARVIHGLGQAERHQERPGAAAHTVEPGLRGRVEVGGEEGDGGE